MRNLLILLVLAVLTLPAGAQSFRFGVKGGANYADINGNKIDENSHRYRLGWHAGAMVNIHYPGNTYFSIQPEIMYSRKGYENYSLESEVKNAQGDLMYTEQSAGMVDLDYIDIPVMLNFKSGIIIFEFGPQFSVLTGADNNAIVRKTFADGTVNTTDDAFRRYDKDRVSKIDLGLATGFRLQTEGGFGLGLRFNQGFIKLDNGDDLILTIPRAPQATNQVFQVYISYLRPE